jgi:hypothetical protein
VQNEPLQRLAQVVVFRLELPQPAVLFRSTERWLTSFREG